MCLISSPSTFEQPLEREKVVLRSSLWDRDRWNYTGKRLIHMAVLTFGLYVPACAHWNRDWSVCSSWNVYGSSKENTLHVILWLPLLYFYPPTTTHCNRSSSNETCHLLPASLELEKGGRTAGVPRAPGLWRLSVLPVRNLFTCGGARDDFRVYVRQKKREEEKISPSGCRAT